MTRPKDKEQEQSVTHKARILKPLGQQGYEKIPKIGNLFLPKKCANNGKSRIGIWRCHVTPLSLSGSETSQVLNSMQS